MLPTAPARLIRASDSARAPFLLIVVVLLLTVLGSCGRAHRVRSGEMEPPSSRPVSRQAIVATSRAALSPLIDAIVERKSVAVILDLIAEGADVNARDREGRSTALYYAALRRDYDGSMLPVVHALVERGADVTARCIGGCTALHAACESSSFEVIQYLISKGADVNATDDYGVTPLHAAARRDSRYPREQRMAIIRLLVAKGAVINATDERGETPRDWASEVSEDRSADVLLGQLGGRYGGRKRGRERKRSGTDKGTSLRGEDTGVTWSRLIQGRMCLEDNRARRTSTSWPSRRTA